MNTEAKDLITTELPITIVSITQTDYGSTTATEINSIAQTALGSEDRGDRYQSAFESRFSQHSERFASHKNSGSGYHILGSSRKSSILIQDSRFPSFINLPDISSGRFRAHPMDSSSKLSNHRANKIKTIEHSLNVLNHVCIGFISIYLSWLCLRNGLAGTALHAWLVTIGFVLLMTEGIMCHYPANVITFNYHRDTKTRIHWILQAIGGTLGMIGSLIKLVQKGFLLKSTHGQLGFAAFLLCGFTMLSGLSALYSMRIKQILSPLFNKTIHNLLGFVTFFLALLAQFYGYRTGYFMRHTESDFRELLKVINILVLLLTSIGPLKAFLKKTQSIFNQHKG